MTGNFDIEKLGTYVKRELYQKQTGLMGNINTYASQKTPETGDWGKAAFARAEKKNWSSGAKLGMKHLPRVHLIFKNWHKKGWKMESNELMDQLVIISVSDQRRGRLNHAQMD